VRHNQPLITRWVFPGPMLRRLVTYNLELIARAMSIQLGHPIRIGSIQLDGARRDALLPFVCYPAKGNGDGQ
jgi:hypothetical protein